MCALSKFFQKLKGARMTRYEFAHFAEYFTSLCWTSFRNKNMVQIAHRNIFTAQALQNSNHVRPLLLAFVDARTAITQQMKKAPCGGTSADPGKPTGAVTKVQGGDKLPIRLRETIFHPGFYL